MRAQPNNGNNKGLPSFVDGINRTKGAHHIFFFWLSTFVTVGLYPFDLSLIQKYGVSTSFLIILISSFTFIITAIVGMLGFLSGKYTLLVSEEFLTKKTIRIIGFINWISLIGWQIVIVYTFYQMLSSSYFNDINGYAFFILVFSFAAVCFPPLLGSNFIFTIKNLFTIIFIIVSLLVLVDNFNSVVKISIDRHDVSFPFGSISALYLASVITSISYTVVSSDYTRFAFSQLNRYLVVSSVFFGSIIGVLVNYLVCLMLYNAGQILILNGDIVIVTNKTSIFMQLILFLSLVSANMPNSYSSYLNLSYISLKEKFKVYSFGLIITFFVLTLLVFLKVGLIGYLYGFMNVLALFLFPWVGLLFSYSVFVLKFGLTNARNVSFSYRRAISVVLVMLILFSSLVYHSFSCIGLFEIIAAFLFSFFVFNG